MSQQGSLSSALRLTDLNDFLTPSTACVLPLEGGATATAKSAPPGSVLAPIIPTKEYASLNQTVTTATVTLSDCLSCTGCVTSAETVLLSSSNVEKAKEVLQADASNPERRKLLVAVGLSQQAVASIAVHFKITLQVAAQKLCYFFTKILHADIVVDISFARHFALEEAALEFIRRHDDGEGTLIASACPGWVTYAEKTQGIEVINAISRVRSPQAIAGAILPHMLRQADGTCKRLWLMTVMPCHDKKLEASRSEFRKHKDRSAVSNDVGLDSHPEVECVLTASEIVQLASELHVDFGALDERPLDPIFSAGPAGFGTCVGSGSGGYADYILRRSCKQLLGIDLPQEPLDWKNASRSGDLRCITIQSTDASKQLTFATAYGFRSLQSVLRKIRRGENSYDYIELMACPGGCNNGGGQIAVEGDKAIRSQHLANVEAMFAATANKDMPLTLPSVQEVYAKTIQGYPGSESAVRFLHTSYERREQSAMAALNNW